MKENKKTFRGKEIRGRFLFFLRDEYLRDIRSFLRDPTGKDLFSD